MTYDLFISYARKDNERGQLAALAEQIKTSFRAFAGRDLLAFFDTHQIQGMDDWRHKDSAQFAGVAPIPRGSLAQLSGQSLLPVGMGGNNFGYNAQTDAYEDLVNTGGTKHVHLG
jgi:hypothetical protein